MSDLAPQGRWFGDRCPLRITADNLRGKPERIAEFVWLASCYIVHAPHCAAAATS